ncbi:hypothetical protein K438DRAFT_360108 [Mycena galopus ATCC 62051]|nr:hypothetical protein K438DRAFT_360108 [Mycena galopus ATCC 62051]
MLIFGITLLATFPWIHAQESEDFGPQQFEWGFNNSVSTSLPLCEKFVLEADSRLSNGAPPYYMMAFAIGGMPITSFIGTNESDLTWTVNNPVGTQLVLGVVDSEGHTGGIAPTLYTVTEGDTTGCVRPTTSASFKVTANVTDVLNTCQPWGLAIEGGMPPYTVTIAGVNSPNVTNITGGLNDSLFTYINRISPGAQMIGKSDGQLGNR